MDGGQTRTVVPLLLIIMCTTLFCGSMCNSQQRCKIPTSVRMDIRANDDASEWQSVSNSTHTFSPNEVAQIRCQKLFSRDVLMYGPEFIVCLLSGSNKVPQWSKKPRCGGKRPPKKTSSTYNGFPDHQTVVCFAAPYDYSYYVRAVGNGSDGRKVLELTSETTFWTSFPPGKTCGLSSPDFYLLRRRNDNETDWIDRHDEHVFWHNEIVHFKCKSNSDYPRDINGPEVAVCQWGTWSVWPRCSDGATDEPGKEPTPFPVGEPHGYRYETRSLTGGKKMLMLKSLEEGHELQTFPFLASCLLDDRNHLLGNPWSTPGDDWFRLHGFTLPQGEWLQLKCLPGYIIDGNEWVGCIDGHLFPEELPYCRSNFTSCPPYTVQPPDGIVFTRETSNAVAAVFRSGDLAFPHRFELHWTCEPGFTYHGSGLTWCDEGQWRGNPGWCQQL